MLLNDRETATVLAALRNVQYVCGAEGGNDLAEMYPDHFAEVAPLSEREIDALCEKINFDNEDPRVPLTNLCLKFIRENEIAVAEDVYQNERILYGLPELVEEICEILGYYEEEVW